MDKLTVEDIKKIFDNFEVDGFELKGSFYGFGLFDSYGSYFNLMKKDCDRSNKSLYPHFLTRVIEGINELNGKYWIDTDKEYINVCYWDLVPNSDIPIVDGELFKIEKDIDQAKTQAIKYILEQL